MFCPAFGGGRSSTTVYSFCRVHSLAFLRSSFRSTTSSRSVHVSCSILLYVMVCFCLEKRKLFTISLLQVVVEWGSSGERPHIYGRPRAVRQQTVMGGAAHRDSSCLLHLTVRDFLSLQNCEGSFSSCDHRSTARTQQWLIILCTAVQC